MVRILAREKNTYIITNILTFAIKKKKKKDSNGYYHTFFAIQLL